MATGEIVYAFFFNRPEVFVERRSARYLRYVPTGRSEAKDLLRQGKEGLFAETDIAIRNDITEPKLTLPGWKDLSGMELCVRG